MNSTKSSKESKIKRRNFFYYLGASVAGIFAISRIPFGRFKSKINSELSKNSRPEIRPSPYSVKRVTGGAKNG